jgi:hypothetical protein
MSAPNPDDPLDNNVADQWKNNEVVAIQTGINHHVIEIMPVTFELIAKQWTQRYAN